MTLVSVFASPPQKGALVAFPSNSQISLKSLQYMRQCLFFSFLSSSKSYPGACVAFKLPCLMHVLPSGAGVQSFPLSRPWPSKRGHRPFGNPLIGDSGDLHCLPVPAAMIVTSITGSSWCLPDFSTTKSPCPPLYLWALCGVVFWYRTNKLFLRKMPK